MGSVTVSNLTEQSALTEITIASALPPELLPLSSSPNLILSPASAVEKPQTALINAGSWRGPLSVTQYLERERKLSGLDLTQNGRQTFWILTFKDDAIPVSPGSRVWGRPILAACETYLKGGYVATNGKLQQVSCHGVGSVYCRDEYRGQGYASRMMEELGHRLETYQQPTDTVRGYFSVLYSDIGIKFYAKHGWKPMISTHILLSPIGQDAYNETVQRLALPLLEDVTSKDLDTICAAATSAMEAALVKKSKERPGFSHVAVRPDKAHMDWHHAREEIQALSLYNLIPNIKGAVDTRSGCAVIWSRGYSLNPSASQLHILHLHIPEVSQDEISQSNPDLEKSIAALLLRAQLEAQTWWMHSGVELWSPEEVTVRAAGLLAQKGEKVEVVVREDEHICSMRWIGGHGGVEKEEVVWLGNEKYAWC